MARATNAFTVIITCPKCKAICVLPKRLADQLTTNVYALNNIQLRNLLENAKYNR